MRILWLTGALLPEATAKIKGEELQQWNTTGSWILGAAAALTAMDDVELFMAATSQDVTELTRIETGRITSYAIPYGKGHFLENRDYDPYMKTIHDEVRPDIVHIHGTEYSHSLSYLRTCGNRHTVISIQGMTSVVHRYYHDGMTLSDIIKHISFRDLIRGGVLRDQKTFKKRGAFEQEMIRSVGHIIGRTSWDYAHTKAINPHIAYHYGGETLRNEFYTGKHWSYNGCQPHTIFMSQANVPYKGLHLLLKALPIILRSYPDTHVFIAGQDPTLGYQSSQWWRLTGYGRYIKSLIKELGLLEHVTFIGPKNAEEMKTELLHSNLYLCPSAIENSPNSLGEAQILGVPCVAAYVGGIMDMMKGNEENLYRYEDIEMMAEKICRVFSNKGTQPDLSAVARERHNPQKNVRDLLETYHCIMGDAIEMC